MNNFLKNIWLLALIIALFLTACSGTGETPAPNDDPEDSPVEVVSKFDLVTKHWSIDTAYHNGVHDASSTGKDIQFYSNGTYKFDNSLTGNWFFTLDSSKIIIDEGLSYQQDWTIEYLDENRFVADFKSPFTGKPSTWIMHEK